jgi:hypothetical protein
MQGRTAKQLVMSVNVGIKGLVLVKLSDSHMCPVKIVSSIFDRVANERLPICRNVVRVIPLMSTFYPDLEGLKECAASLICTHFGTDDDISSSAAASSVLGKRKVDSQTTATDGQRPIDFCVQFKHRNHDTLKREEVQGVILELVPKGFVVNYRSPEVPLRPTSHARLAGREDYNMILRQILRATRDKSITWN